jgi:hypothetical protein
MNTKPTMQIQVDACLTLNVNVTLDQPDTVDPQNNK